MTELKPPQHECEECDWEGATPLEAPNPFEPGILRACPVCKSVNLSVTVSPAAALPAGDVAAPPGVALDDRNGTAAEQWHKLADAFQRSADWLDAGVLTGSSRTHPLVGTADYRVAADGLRMLAAAPPGAKAKRVKQRLMKMAREVDGLNWGDRMCIGEAIALIDAAYPGVTAVRECCNSECGWKGETDRMLGSVGPLCPDCGEVTEPTNGVEASDKPKENDRG